MIRGNVTTYAAGGSAGRALLRACSVGVALAAALPAMADDAAGRDARAARCAETAGDAARLACYDAVYRDAREPGAARPATTAPVPEPAPATEPARAPEAVFGLENRAAAPAPAVDAIESAIASVRTLRDGALVVTLENGQTWRQIDDKGMVRWRVGDALVVERGALGSFLAGVGNARKVRVRRER